MLLALVALSPIAIILVLMLFFRQSAARAGIVGLGVSLLLSFTLFDIGVATGLANASQAATGALAEAVFTAATILWIIFGALCLHQLQMKTGAIDVLRKAVGALSKDPRMVAILIAWFFALFIEGAAGFGTSVALAAPFLVSFGFRPVAAVTIAMIGHSVGVSFGAVGTPILPQVAVTPFEGLEIGGVTGFYHLLLGWVMLIAVMLIVRRQFEQGELIKRSMVGWVALAAFAFLGPMYAIARWIGPELPTLGGAVVGAMIFVIALRLAGEGKKDHEKPPEGVALGELLRAASPYLMVITLILLTRLIGPVQGALRSVEWTWTLWGEFTGSFEPLYHPGTMLVLGFLVGALIQRAGRETLGEAARAAIGQLGPVTVALIAMLGISRLMVHSQMIEALAEAAAAGAGGAWPFFAPWVGVLGTFVTGSATASNILFTDFQQSTAQTLGIEPLKTLGAQGFGAAVGNIICPHNIIAGCATVGIAGQEGEILRRTLGACALYAVLGGGVAWVWVAWG